MTTLDALYAQLTDHIIASGKRIKTEAGKIDDIGKAKPYLTVEDLRLERELTALIHAKFPDHKIYAEEERAIFESGPDVWVIDPISGTATFIAGMPHYALVITHVHDGRPRFAAVYDPSVDELYTATAGQGAFLNNQPIHVSGSTASVILNLTRSANPTTAAAIWQRLNGLTCYRNANSFAVNYCWVAAGRCDGVIAVSKDSFPEYAGWLIIQEAGGTFTNAAGEPVQASDRHFVGGNNAVFPRLQSVIESL